MPKLNPSLLQRIVDRVKQEFTPTRAPAQQPQQPQDPAKTTNPAAPDETLPPGLLERIKQRVQDVFKAPQVSVLPSAPPSVAAQRAMIHLAGQRSVCLVIKYNNQWRLMEPYSFRRGKGGEPRFFCWCRLHDSIHGIYLSRVQGMVLANEGFAPRWTVEV